MKKNHNARGIARNYITVEAGYLCLVYAIVRNAILENDVDFFKSTFGKSLRDFQGARVQELINEKLKGARKC